MPIQLVSDFPECLRWCHVHVSPRLTYTMETPNTYSLTALSARHLEDLSETECADLIAYFDPDTVIVIADGEPAPTVSRATWTLDTTVADTVHVHALPDTDLVVQNTTASTIIITSTPVTHADISERLPSDGHGFVVTDAVSVEMDPMSLSASIDGLDAFRGHDTALTVFSSELATDYWVEFDDVTVRGLAPIDEDTEKASRFTFYDDALVTEDQLAITKLGIRAIDGMGETYADRFRSAGYETVEDIAEASRVELKRIEGVRDTRAEQFEKRAQALVENEIIRLSDDASLPSDVVCIDIETDGLTPSIIWQIAVYDPDADEVETFLQKDPDEKAGILREFGAWLSSNLDGRAVVAYNGWGFDFPHLTEFFEAYCSEYADVWRRAYKVDPYEWAATKGNVAFPCRSGKLDDVAAALGYEAIDTGLDGATTGRAYQRWMRNPCDETELDWERHTEYCRDDVLALYHIYECLLNTGRVLGAQNTDRPTEENTSQGSLFDY